MKLRLPLSLFAAVAVAASSLVAQAETYTVDASMATDSGNRIYATLQDLLTTVTLASGDTITLYNDDNSLLSGVIGSSVTLQSSELGTSRTIDLSRRASSSDPLFSSNGSRTFNLNGIIFSGAKQTQTGASANGGVIYSYNNTSSVTLGDGVTFTGNSTTSTGTGSTSAYGNSYGGVIYSKGPNVSSTVILGSSSTFTGNYAVALGSATGTGKGYSYGYGGAIFSDSYDSSLVTLGGGAVFAGNYVSSTGTGSGIGFNYAYGGAIYSTGDTSSITLGDGAIFTDNHSNASGSAASYVYSYGGAIYSTADISSVRLGNGSIFSGNYAISTGSACGGAIYTYGSSSSFVVADGAEFTGNYAKNSGGAIYLETYTSAVASGVSSFLALTQDSLFSGNMVGGTPSFDSTGKLTGVTGGTANAIHFLGDYALELAAGTGRSLLFEDPITSAKNVSNSEGVTLSINRYSERNSNGAPTGVTQITNGAVTFSGEQYQGSLAYLQASRYSNILAKTTVYGGVFELRDNVVFGRTSGAGSTFALKPGATLLSSGSTGNSGVSNILNAGTITLESGSILAFNLAAAEEGTSLLQLNGVIAGTSPVLELTALNSVAGNYTLLSTNGSTNLTGITWTLTYKGQIITDNENERLKNGLAMTVDSNRISLNQTLNSLALVWTGAENSVWNEVAWNWKISASGTPCQFLDGDTVAFLSGGSVALTGAPVVGDMLVNTDQSLSFTGAGIAVRAIDPWNYSSSTEGRLVKQGTGTLNFTALTGTNVFEGGIYMEDGVLKVSRSGQLGGADITASGGTLYLSAYNGELSNSLSGTLNVTLGEGSNVTMETPNIGLSGTVMLNPGTALHLKDAVAIGNSNIDNRGELALYTPEGGGNTIRLPGHLGGVNGIVHYEHIGDTLQVASLNGSQLFVLDVNIATGESDRIVIDGTVGGIHHVVFTNLGDASLQGNTVYDIVTYGVMVPGTQADRLFTGSVDHGMDKYSLVHREGAPVYDLVLDGYSSQGQVLLNIMGSMGAAWFDQLDTVLKRMGELRLGADFYGSGMGSQESARPLDGRLWVRSTGSRVDSDLGISGVSGFTEYQYGGDMGADWILSRKDDHMCMGGVFAGYQRSNREFASAGGSTGNTDSYYGGLYGTYLNKNGWYMDAVLKGQSWDTSWEARNANGVDRGQYDNWGVGVSLEVGKQWEFQDRWFVEPGAQIAWLHADGQDVNADNGLHLSMDSAEICQFAARVRGGRTIGLGNGQIVQPYVKAGFIERASSGGEIRSDARSWRPNTDGEYVMAGAGIIWQLSSRDQIHLDYEYQYGEKYDRPWTVNLGYVRSF